MGVPLPNLISDQRVTKSGLTALLTWDNSVLDFLVVPEGLDRNLVMDTIVMEAGDRELLHPKPSYMKWAIGRWSQKMLPIWTKLYETTQYEYDPIYNYDRTEEVTDSRTIDRNRTQSNRYSENTDEDSTTNQSGTEGIKESSEHNVSAENVGSYQPDAIDIRTGDNTNSLDTDVNRNVDVSGNSSGDEDEKTTETFTHKARMFGNIGVTTTQQMIEQERNVVRFTVIDQIVADFVDEFCLLVW